MRLWTVHPRFLDAKGLTALWREGLLARKVLHGETKGYTNHPQLIRFRAQSDPLLAIDAYLAAVLAESRERGYKFDASKIDTSAHSPRVAATTGQLAYEWKHLLRKLQKRDPARWERHKTSQPEPHPQFIVEAGDIADWEKT
ncbi:pyrimidine dimer DNA glycosylase/endonuclease V [Pseudodesulfovibrio sediminis]|uniref:Pyrimidine dimer DNA glycosylase /DNA-(Apurinic or apyrimidinic site) lyase n=1 Tax=Pseudodesulfovibrio sediminis TaxID=2810563 RepID=A0ABN6EVI9_9BACT|nr:pyrimidine dimer DNA glycosylase/endonuclease V [Pseudodesulfovibrio sediminis]BCS89255.1 pyrimidine dimer DNA glycosylase /DNA-(apurinic or apyrimidinic site) lyase [Pseudodesulfovibrio sediminis]